MPDKAVGALPVVSPSTSDYAVVEHAGATSLAEVSAILALGGGGGGGSGFSFALVQAASSMFSNGATNTVTFRKAATAGNTLILWCAYAFSAGAATTPSGWTKIFEADDSDYTGIIIYTKLAAGGETSVSMAGAGGTYSSLYMVEIPGNHSVLDQSTSGTGSANAQFVTSGGLTPTSGAVVVGAVGYCTQDGAATVVNPSLDNTWALTCVGGTAGSPRIIIPAICFNYASGAEVYMPPVNSAGNLTSQSFVWVMVSLVS